MFKLKLNKFYFFVFFILFAAPSAPVYADALSAEVKQTAEQFFTAMVQRDAESEQRYFDWENPSFYGIVPDNMINTLIQSYRSGSEGRRAVVGPFVDAYNKAFLDWREKRLGRKLELSDFKIILCQGLGEKAELIFKTFDGDMNWLVFRKNAQGAWVIAIAKNMPSTIQP